MTSRPIESGPPVDSMVSSPRFEAPQPTRTQRLALRAASMLIGAENPEIDKVSHRLVQDVGGYEESNVFSAFSSESTPTRYKHKDAQADFKGALQDETTKGLTVPTFGSASEFGDARGITGQDQALNATLSRNRASGHKAKTVKGRLARGLVDHAIKGVGTQGHR